MYKQLFHNQSASLLDVAKARRHWCKLPIKASEQDKEKIQVATANLAAGGVEAAEAAFF